MEQGPKFDAIVIGTALRRGVGLSPDRGRLRVCVLERGRRFQREDFPVFPPADIPGPESDPAAAKVEAPDSGLLFWGMNHGMWDLRDLGEILAAQAAGYGGGSLVYANVHLRPPAEAFEEGWPDDYRAHKLERYFDLAAYMLDVKPYPKEAPKLAKTGQLEGAAKQLRERVHCFRPPLAINFGPPCPGATETIFGQSRDTVTSGECCFGCHAMAGTLDLNYLALAVEGRRGALAEIRTLAEVL
jgi:cholesterol oxidase